MPIIRIEMMEGRSRETKQRLAREMTKLLAEIIDCDPAVVRVLIDDYGFDDWAVGGELESDRRDRPSS
jgi:4-oxalocrotonate tautomerase